jgi:hypothetical protein
MLLTSKDSLNREPETHNNSNKMALTKLEDHLKGTYKSLKLSSKIWLNSATLAASQTISQDLKLKISNKGTSVESQRRILDPTFTLMNNRSK